MLFRLIIAILLLPFGVSYGQDSGLLMSDRDMLKNVVMKAAKEEYGADCALEIFGTEDTGQVLNRINELAKNKPQRFGFDCSAAYWLTPTEEKVEFVPKGDDIKQWNKLYIVSLLSKHTVESYFPKYSQMIMGSKGEISEIKSLVDESSGSKTMVHFKIHLKVDEQTNLIPVGEEYGIGIMFNVPVGLMLFLEQRRQPFSVEEEKEWLTKFFSKV